MLLVKFSFFSSDPNAHMLYVAHFSSPFLFLFNYLHVVMPRMPIFHGKLFNISRWMRNGVMWKLFLKKWMEKCERASKREYDEKFFDNVAIMTTSSAALLPSLFYLPLISFSLQCGLINLWKFFYRYENYFMRKKTYCGSWREWCKMWERWLARWSTIFIHFYRLIKFFILYNSN